MSLKLMGDRSKMEKTQGGLRSIKMIVSVILLPYNYIYSLECHKCAVR